MPDPNPAEFFEIFNEVGIIVQFARTRLEARLPDGLIASHFTVLNHLVRVSDGATPQRMARAFQVPKTSRTHTLQVLERRGLIEMRHNPEDGRSKTVWITDAGRALRAGVIADLSPPLLQLLGEFGTDRLIAIKPVLTDLRRFLDENRERG